MSFIKIVDVILNSGQRSRLGGPSSLTGKSEYDKNTYRYPIDVGNYDKGHYILIHVNQQTTTQFKWTKGTDDPVIFQNLTDLQERRGSVNLGQSINSVGSTISREISNKYGQEINTSVNTISGGLFGKFSDSSSVTNAKEFLGGTVSGIADASKSINGGFLRKIQRTTDTIALYMPDTMSFGYAQSYSDPALSNSLLSQGAAAASTAIDSQNAADAGRNLSPFIMNIVGNKLGDTGKALFTAATGMVQNPMLEVIYTSPRFRTFQFTFAFYPRSEAEATEVQKILDRLRFHQAPEIKANSGGMFLIPPSEFDIKFMYNGKENPNIDKVSTCVLTDIQVDYAKTGGFTAYEVEGENTPSLGRTGMPVGIGLSLTFMETQILTKEYYNKGGAAGEVQRLGGTVQDFLSGSNGFGNYGE